MTIATEWQQQANDQLSVNNRVRLLALRSLNLIERAADYADSRYDKGNHPENFIEYFKLAGAVLDPERIDILSKIIARTINSEFMVTSQQYNDINKMAKELNRLGYRILPKKDAQAETKQTKKGYSPETVNMFRQALYGNIVGASK